MAINEQYLQFNMLNERTKELFFEILEAKEPEIFNGFWPYFMCEYDSELEKLMAFALGYSKYQFEPQYEVVCGEKKYYIDFMFLEEFVTHHHCLSGNNLRIAIECDGYNYHSSKEQISYDNERDMKLRMAGVEVLRFTGTQIYADPMKCVREIDAYIAKRMREQLQIKNKLKEKKDEQV